MIHLPRDRRTSFFLLLATTVVVLIGMLYFGIRLKGFRPGNNVQWSGSGVGLAFGRFAQAYTDGFFSAVGGSLPEDDLTVELAIRPVFSNYSGFRFLVLVHDGDDNRQLVVGQWRSSLVIMNGNDYSNRQRIPKIYFELDGQGRKTHFITIVSNAAGTRLFLDGVLKKRNGELVLRYPNREAASTRLVVGNSLDGNHPWIGTISGLAFYDRDLSDAAVRQHYHRWRLARDFSGFQPDAPRLLYAFDEGQGERVFNKLGDGLDLKVPAWMKVLKTRVLSWPRFEEVGSASLFEDILINLTGFAPLGFLLLATLSRFEGIGDRAGMLTALLFVFSFSLGIEIVQVWIPSRDSSMLDLILNTLGGWFGALLFRWMRKWAGVLHWLS